MEKQMNNKQSSVEWYRIESQKLMVKAIRKEITQKEWVLLENKLGEQAKAMHKDEIENFAEWFNESGWSCFDNTERGNVYANPLVTDEVLTIGEIYELYLKYQV